MSVTIIDRRQNPKGKNLSNRQRFIERYRKAIQEAVRNKIIETDITDAATDAPKQINISRSETHEPTFHHRPGGVHEEVLPGNKRFVPGDQLIKPQNGGRGAGPLGAPDGAGEDDFLFEVSSREFLDALFQGLELPDMVKKMLVGDAQFERHRAGFSPEGAPPQVDLPRSLQRAQVRRTAFSAAKRRKIRALEEERARLLMLLETQEKE